MARNCGECLMDQAEVVALAEDGKCPKCKTDYGPDMPRLVPVKLGAEVAMDRKGRKPKKFVVVAACEEKHAGCWACVTHDEVFRNQFEKDTHIREGAHLLAWVCPTHGIEVP